MKCYLINTETNQWPIYEGDFRYAHQGEYPENEPLIPNIPFAWVEDVFQPEHDPFIQRCIEVDPAEVDGVWKRQWCVVDLEGDELIKALKAKAIFDRANRGVPAKVSMRQARLQLLSIGKYTDVNAAIKNLSEAAQIEWEYATEVELDNPLVSEMKKYLNWTDTQMENYFVEASKL